MNQLLLELRSPEPYGLRYLVPHSGISEALDTLLQALECAQTDPSFFQCFLLRGPSGAGKTHMALAALSADTQLVSTHDFSEQLTAEAETELFSVSAIARFVSEYEKRKNSGGLFIVVEPSSQEVPLENPHLASRIDSSMKLDLALPREEEISALITSLAERHNLKLSDRNIEYLIKRSPLNPSFFDDLLQQIGQLSGEQKSPASLKYVRSAYEQTLVRDDSTEN